MFEGLDSGEREQAGVEQQKNILPENTYISIGGNALQVDIGYRPHWFGPFQESDMLISTNAPTAPGITFSNNIPFKFLGIRYEVFLAQLSQSDKILSADRSQRLSGKPKLLGMHFSIEPLSGFAIGVNRLLQYGGGDRDESADSIISAFFNPKNNDNWSVEDGVEDGADFGNQLVSITTRYTFSGEFPMAVYMSYAGEDTSAASNRALGNTALMLGIHMPLLAPNLDFTYEYASWQNSWYVNGVFGDGLRNYDTVMGHWAASQREFTDAVGATSHILKLVWSLERDRMLLFKFRQVRNESYSAYDYQIGNELSVEYSRPLGKFTVGVSGLAGESVFGESYSRAASFIRW